MERYICIHGHFYQPPRENPWLEAVELQDSAYPYHDWNERITVECYGPNTAARLLDSEQRIFDIINNYSRMSFNFGPTLLSWLESHQPDVYQAILDADRLSMERFSGHGSALAQVYNHMIMPLANRRDKVTQVKWGIRDFEKRFGRFPEGMWLPETAVDTDTLEVLAECGIKFTILAPRQARRMRRMARGARWQEVNEGRVDPTTAYLCVLPSKKTINLFFYDGPISQDIAFGGLLTSGESLAQRLVSAFADERDWPQLVHVATDGETYGHHHRFGEMALAYCFHFIESQNLAKITNYGEYLEKTPPRHWVDIHDNSSWSCIHGVERWKENCGCNSGMHGEWTQAWRKPLREAMDWLRDTLASLYEEKAETVLKNPWEAREGYIELLLDRTVENIETFLARHGKKELTKEEKSTVLKLLEMQRHTMLMYTSCGWFFDEISGIETTQVMQYAARAIQLSEQALSVSVEKDYVGRLSRASSNIPELEQGAKIYDMFVRPAALDLLRVGAHYAISSLFEEYPETIPIFCYTADSEVYDRMEAGKMRLAVGKTRIQSEMTWDEEQISFAVLHLGDHNLNGGVRKFMGDEAFSLMLGEIKEAFKKGDIPETIRLMDKHFGMNNYSLWHLFKDEQRKVLQEILRSTFEGIEVSLRKIYEENYTIMSFLKSLRMPLPKPLAIAAEYTVNVNLRKIFEEENPITEKLQSLIHETKQWSFDVDKSTLGFVATSWINAHMGRLIKEPENSSFFEKMETMMRLLASLSATPDLSGAQNHFFSMQKQLYGSMKGRAEAGDEAAKKWIEALHRLGALLYVKVS